MKYILFTSICFLMFSCSINNKFSKNQKNISTELKYIYVSDQIARKYESMLNSKYELKDVYFIFDSLRKAGVEGNYNDVYNFSKIKSIKEQLSTFSEEKRQEYKNDVKDANLNIHLVDSVNFKKFYGIIKEYGYPSYYNREWKDSTNRVGTALILTHFDYSTKKGKKFLKLMIKEYFSGRVNEGEMKQLMWHVDGRVDGPPYKYKLDNNKLKEILKEN